MEQTFAVMAGGAIGAALRFHTGLVATRIGSASWWPAGTLSVNLIGALAMGLLAGAAMRTPLSDGWRLFLGTGLLGGFTTFSAFSLELFRLLEQQDWAAAAAYAALSVGGTVALVAAGFALARAMWPA